MKTTVHSKRTTAFTLIELIVCIVCVLVLLLVILPIFNSCTYKIPKRIVCFGNLKQLGLAVYTYALDNEERYPWNVPTSEGGTKELAEPFLSMDTTPFLTAKEVDLNQIPDTDDWYRKNNISKDQTFSYHFAFLTNTLDKSDRYFPNFQNKKTHTPIITCPCDSLINKKIKSFQDLIQSPDGGRFNISYFINLETINDKNTPKAFLFGDRNLFCSRLPVMTNSVNPILFQLGTETDSENFSDVQWTPVLHTNRGNVIFADGSVQTILNTNLQSYLTQSTNSFNRIVLPFGKRP